MQQKGVNMKRRILLLLAIIMISSVLLCACGETGSAVATPRPTEETYNLAMQNISKGQYELGYSALLSIKSYDKAAEALADFVQLPVSIAERKKGETNSANYEITNFIYDSKGTLTDIKILKNDMVTGLKTFKYEEGLLKTSIYTTPTGKKDTLTYTFDGNGKLVETLLKDKDENFSRTVYEYTSEGKIYKAIKTDYDGTVFTDEYSYGDNGKIRLKYTYKEKDGVRETVGKVEYNYNDRDLVINATKTVGDDVSEMSFSGYRLFYIPDYKDIMLYY